MILFLWHFWHNANRERRLLSLNLVNDQDRRLITLSVLLYGVILFPFAAIKTIYDLMKCVFPCLIFVWGMLKGIHWGQVVKHTQKNYSLVLPTYLVYQNLFCGTFICLSSVWHLDLKLGCHCWSGKRVAEINIFITSFNELATYKRYIKALKDRLL